MCAKLSGLFLFKNLCFEIHFQNYTFCFTEALLLCKQKGKMH